MTTQHIAEPFLDFGKLEEYAGKVAADQAAAYNAILVHLGDRLGIWRSLAALGAATIAELAAHCGVAPRHLQEWLSAQVANGYLTYDAAAETFTLSPEGAAVLAEEESPSGMMAGFELIAAVWASVDKLAGRFDLVLFFDAVHDFGDPVAALARARASLAPGSRVVAIEPYAEDGLEANLANPIAAVFYVGSSALCVPHSISDGGAALGAQAGPARLAQAFRDAGFSSAGVATSTATNLVIEAHP